MELISGENAILGSSLGHRRAFSTLAAVESLSMPLTQEIVLIADIGCFECRKRITKVMSRMSGVESMTVSVREKKVTLSCRCSCAANIMTPKPQVPAIYRKRFSKIAFIKKIFRAT